MKKILFFYVCLSLSFNGICQKMGIGFLKIDSTTIDDLLQTTKMRLEFQTTQMTHTEGNIYQLIELPETFGYGPNGKKDPGLDAYMRSKFIDGYKVFEIPLLKISDLSLTNITLVFLNDTLISFHSDYSYKLDEILTYKYGEPKIISKTDTVYCTYTYTGAMNSYRAYELISIWSLNNYKSVYYSEKKYDDKCKEKFFSYFHFENSDKDNKYISLCRDKEKLMKEKLKKEVLGKY